MRRRTKVTCLIIVFPLIHRGERYNCALKIEKNVLLLRANIIYKGEIGPIERIVNEKL